MGCGESGEVVESSTSSDFQGKVRKSVRSAEKYINAWNCNSFIEITGNDGNAGILEIIVQKA